MVSDKGMKGLNITGWPTKSTDITAISAIPAIPAIWSLTKGYEIVEH